VYLLLSNNLLFNQLIIFLAIVHCAIAQVSKRYFDYLTVIQYLNTVFKLITVLHI